MFALKDNARHHFCMASDHERLIERIRRLPPARLHDLEKVVAALECGGSTPLWMEGATPERVMAPNPKLRPAAALHIEPPHAKFDWPHAPLHRLAAAGTYLVTAGTFYKQHFFADAARLDLLQANLLALAKQYGWRLEAWAVFSNHYHFVGHTETTAATLKTFLSELHTQTAAAINDLDRQPKRKVWHNFWETQLSYERSYLARLNYVHQNPVKHGLVAVAHQYRWCSAAWFERTATRAQVKTIYSFKMDKLRVLDDFDVIAVK